MLGQFPQYLAQYLQRLGGHIDEARHLAALYSLPEVMGRITMLSQGLQAIKDADPFWRGAAFLMNAQWDIAWAALQNFTPGMAFTQEELIYLAAGCLVGVSLYAGLKGIARTLRGWIRRGKPSPGSGKRGAVGEP